jgi:hypothetical protein
MSAGLNPRENAMRLRSLVVSAALIAVATPALATDYYVVREAQTGKCSVKTERPDGTKLVMVGTKTYASEKEAKAAKKAADECKKSKSK